MKYFFYIVIVCFFTINSTFSQSRKALELRRKELNKEMQKIEEILSETRREKADALSDLRDFNQKIVVRKKIIETIELENKQISNDINRNQQKIKRNNEELKTLKKDYAKMIFKSYQSRSRKSKAMFLMSSKNFYQAYKRLKYIDQYKSFQKNQAKNIIEKTKLVGALNDSLVKIKEEKLTLIAQQEEEAKKIEEELAEQEKLVANIKGEESKYRTQLEKKEKEDKKIAFKIEEILAKAIKKANKGKKSSSKKEFVLSKAEKNLKTKFEQNKGKLPSPVNSGYVTRRFGIQPHPTFRKIKINSTGVHIRCRNGDDAKAVFKGKVLVVQLLSQGRKSVFVQHGNYITTYTNLEDVYVKPGDMVKTRQPIGKVFTDKVTGETSLQFILSKNTKRLNPEKWVKI